MIDLIHIGDYKTGTSWLQKYAFRQHPELIYIDNPEVFPNIAMLFYELVDARDLDFDPLSLRGRFQAEIDKIDRAGKKLVVSREALFGDFLSGDHALRIAKRLYQVFGSTRVLVVIREQISMIASIYSQYVKTGGTVSLDEFVWDPFYAKNLVGRLQYAKVIRAYGDTFGADRVMIRLYDELKTDNDGFLRDVFTFVGCEETDFKPIVHKTTNPSLTNTGAAVQRLLNRLVRTPINPSAGILPLDRIIGLFLTNKQRERLLKSAEVQLPGIHVNDAPDVYLSYAINMGLNLKLSQWCEKIQVGDRVGVPENIREQLESYFVADNRILMESYGLKLDQHGWIV